jgi:hypothetical protein
MERCEEGKYVVPRNAGPQPVIEAGTTLINKENLLRAYAKSKRENIEYKNGVDKDTVLMSDRQFIQTILNALTDDYGNLIEKVTDKIDEGTAFGIEDLKEKLAAKYTRIKVWGKQERNETHDHALYGTDAAPSYYAEWVRRTMPKMRSQGSQLRELL